MSWQQLKHTDFSDHTYAHLVSTLNRVAPQTSSHSPLNKLSKYFCLEVHDNVIPTLQWCRYFEIPLRQDFLSSTDLHLCDRFVFPQKGNLLEILIRFPAHPNHPTVTSVGVLNATNTATSPLISASSSTPPSNTSLISPFLIQVQDIINAFTIIQQQLHIMIIFIKVIVINHQIILKSF